MHIKIKDSKAYYQESRTLNLLTLWQSTSNLIKTRQSNASPEMLIEACVSFTWLQAGLKRLPELMLLQLWGNIERMFWTTGSGPRIYFSLFAEHVFYLCFCERNWVLFMAWSLFHWAVLRWYWNPATPSWHRKTIYRQTEAHLSGSVNSGSSSAWLNVL